MAIHITRRELKIKTRLFAALVIILGTMSILYFAFCKGKGYSQIKIETKQTEAVGDEPTKNQEPETPDEPVSDSEPEPENQDGIENEGESDTEPESESEPESKPHISWESYDPLEVLAGDDWMLALINANHPIGKNYSPNLSPIISGSMVTADSRVSEAYQKMYNDAKAQDIILAPYAAYLSYYRQQENYNNLVNNFIEQGMSEEEAKNSANSRIDEPGTSESGAGLSVDIIGTSSDFDKTKEYAWLTANAHKYGFILRYPEEKFAITGVRARPWHWRYVGVDAATEIKTQNLCLEEYLEKNN
ncbi:MAG: D-alanyl-D-alanine carboxypeptidase family protein [Oscillospiraceae bacterium]|nr:D-alanyl-D-alanine carboxypeptidase family protein [Oscillospiraceae bacterium]